MASPGKYDITVYQRTSIAETFNLFSDAAKTVIFDLTGYTVKAYVVDDNSLTIPGRVFNLNPQMTSPLTLGEITIAKTAAEVIAATFMVGVTGPVPKWDLILTHTATGVILPPVLQGSFIIKEVYTP